MWTAKFKNGEVISQIDGQGKEVPFKRVLDYDGELENFVITFVNKMCSVNLIDGIFTIVQNNTPIEIYTLDSDLHNKPTEFKYRLVYFERCMEQISSNTSTQSGVVFTAVGWQTNDKSGKNIKRILKIHANGLLELVGK